MEDPFQQRKHSTTTTTMLPGSFPPPAAPSTFSPTSTHGGDAEGAGLGGYPHYYHADDATLRAAQGHVQQQQPGQQSLPPLEMPPPYDGYAPSVLHNDLLRLVGVLEAENGLLEALALGRLQQQQEQDQEVASTIADLKDARALLEAYEAERQRLEARVEELGGEASAARARAAAAEASVGGRAAALETQVRALEQRLRDRGFGSSSVAGPVEAAVAAARDAWEREAEALVARAFVVEGAAEGADAADAAAAEQGGFGPGDDGEEPPAAALGGEDGDWRARLESMAARRRREEGRLRRRLLSTFRALVAEREARARVEGEVGVVKARLVGMEEEFRSRVLGGGVEEAERQRDAARVELAAARAAADSANTRVGALEAEVKALRAAAAAASGGGVAGGDVMEAQLRALEEENAGLKAAVAKADERAVGLEAELSKAREQGQGGGVTPPLAAASPFAGTSGGRKRLDAAFAGVSEVETVTALVQPSSSRVAWLLAQRSPSTAADADRLRRLAGEVSDVLRIAGRAAAAEAERDREAMMRGQVTELERVKQEGERALATTRAVVASQGRALLRAQAAGAVVACWCRWKRRRGPALSLGEAFARWRGAAVVVGQQEAVESAPPSPLLPSWEGGGVEESKSKGPRPPSV